MRLKDWIRSKLFWIKTGSHLELANGGKPIEEVVIAYKEYFFMIDIDAESGEPTGGFGWSRDIPMTPTPVRDQYIAVRRREYAQTE